jgi:hypothetical protein
VEDDQTFSTLKHLLAPMAAQYEESELQPYVASALAGIANRDRDVTLQAFESLLDHRQQLRADDEQAVRSGRLLLVQPSRPLVSVEADNTFSTVGQLLAPMATRYEGSKVQPLVAEALAGVAKQDGEATLLAVEKLCDVRKELCADDEEAVTVSRMRLAEKLRSKILRREVTIDWDAERWSRVKQSLCLAGVFGLGAGSMIVKFMIGGGLGRRGISLILFGVPCMLLYLYMAYVNWKDLIDNRKVTRLFRRGKQK